MPAEVKKEIQLEIAHVLFIDIVGYSKRLINEQRALLDVLNQVVRGTDQFRSAEAAGRLIKIPTGDGMALVFYNTPEAPVECALEISRALKGHPELRLRMGAHSGPVSGVIDVNERANIAGAGINVAQRVMDCGDAGHILLSKHVAEDLEQYGHWQPHLHDLGECEIKHGGRVHVVNLYTEELGNPELPERFSRAPVEAAVSAAAQTTSGRKYILVTGALMAVTVLALFLFLKVGTPLRGVRQIETGRPGGASLPAIPEKSIAVLPFENLSEEKANAFFADGVQDEILTDLAKIADLKVISRRSVMQYKSDVPRNLRQIGQELGVAHLLEGSVQRAANRVRVNAQLIDTRTDTHLWAQTYDRDLADVFAIQSEIAKAIADQLQAKLSPTEKKAIEQPPTADVTAFDLYTQAKNLVVTTGFSVLQEKSLLQAVDLLNQAVARDPSFFQAYCQLASVHDQIYFLGSDHHTPARLALAEAALQAAFRLRPDAGEAHLARAENLYWGHLDYNGALSELEMARRSLPNHPRIFELTGFILRRRGEQEEGLRNLEHAIDLDPRNVFTLQQTALSYQFLRRYPEEAAVVDRSLTIVPDNVETKVVRAIVDFYWKADTRPLHKTIDSVLAESPGSMATAADNWFLCALAERDSAAAERALATLGDNPCFADGAIVLRRSFGEALLTRMKKDDARARSAFTAARTQQEKIVQAQPGYGPALCVLGLIDAALGRNEAALQEGRRAMELLPVEKDSINGARLIVYFAMMAAWMGEKDLALQQLAIGAPTSGGSMVASYGGLKLLPFWDPLRGDPRFEKIVASFAPK
jgi:TolB-like protein/class 3 adenylate cyclase